MDRNFQVVDKNTVKFYNGWTMSEITLDRRGLTDNETEIMVAIRNNEYSDDLTDCAPWTFCFEWNTSISKRSIRGVLSSLVKKELIEVEPYDGDTMTYLTEKGANRYSDGENWRGRK